MLRELFGEPRRQDEGEWWETNQAIKQFTVQLRQTYGSGKVDDRFIRLDLWASGLAVALDELEQSVYCSGKLARSITSPYEDEMSERERTEYYRHIYFYKNAFIRLFSLLDKTGFFLDTLFRLETAKVKHRFSYFTVLRQMHVTSTHTRLEQKLFDLKVKYREPLDRLRKKRNLEIHSINAELIDDIWRKRSKFADRHEIESIEESMRDLLHGYEMACRSLKTIFEYSKEIVNTRQRRDSGER